MKYSKDHQNLLLLKQIAIRRVLKCKLYEENDWMLQILL